MALNINELSIEQRNLYDSIIQKYSNSITKTIVVDVMNGLKMQWTFKTLAQNKIRVTLEEDLNKSDKKTQEIYSSLFRNTLNYIKTNSQPVLTVFAGIETDTNDQTMSGKFLGSYIFQVLPGIIPEVDEKVLKSVVITKV